MRLKPAATSAICALMMTCAGAAAEAESFDVIIRGGTVLDGTGLGRYVADVGVRRGHIADIGDLSKDTGVVELHAKGLFVAPGFINIHDHPEPNAVFKAENVLTQGVTTEIGNPDGMGSTDANARGSTDIAAQSKSMAAKGLATNLGFYIGFNAVWAEVMGPGDHRATPVEIDRMQRLVTRGLEAGAWGVSAGLDYKPGYFARLDEVERIVEVARPWRTNFPNHERLTPEDDYSSLIGVKETVLIGEKAGIAPVFTHMKSQGSEQQRAQDILDLMDEATRSGHYAAGDIYPYTYGFNNVRALLIPGWALEGGEDALYARFKDPAARRRIVADVERVMGQRWNGPTGVYVVTLNRELTDIMAEWQVSAGEAIIRLNEQYRGRLPETYLRFGTEDDMIRMLKHPNVAVACDCGSLLPVAGHPRAFGTFPRVLGHYVRETAVLTWEDAIRKMSGLPASIIGIADRGLLAPGMAADVAVFDPIVITDRGTPEAPQLSEGMRHVLVNGRLAVKDGRVTGEQGGALIRRTANMPTRTFMVDAPRRIAGAAALSGGAAGARLNLDLHQGTGRRAAEGRLTVADATGREIFAAQKLGVLQTAQDWASITGEGRLANGETRAFILILDVGKTKPANASSVVLNVDSTFELGGRTAGTIRLSERR